MWAFALLDAPRRDAALLARPLRHQAALLRVAAATGSRSLREIKALLARPARPREPNERAVRDYLLDRATGRGTDETFFAGIRQLPPAHDAGARPATARRDLRLAPLLGAATQARRRAGRRRRRALRARCCATRCACTCAATCRSGTCLERRPRLLGRSSASPRQLRRADAIPSYAHRGVSYVPGDDAALRAPVHARRSRAAPAPRSPTSSRRSERRRRRHPRPSCASRTSRSARRASPRSGTCSARPRRSRAQGHARRPGRRRVPRRLPGLPRASRADRSPARIAARWRSRSSRSTPAGAPARWPLAAVEALGLRAQRRPRASADGHARRAAAGHRRSSPPAAAPRGGCRPTGCVEPPATLAEHAAPPPHGDRAAGAAALRGPQLDGALDRGARAVPRPSPRRVRAEPARPRRSCAAPRPSRSCAARWPGTLPEAVRARRDKIGFRAEPAVTWCSPRAQRDAFVARAAT